MEKRRKYQKIREDVRSASLRIPRHAAKRLKSGKSLIARCERSIQGLDCAHQLLAHRLEEFSPAFLGVFCGKINWMSEGDARAHKTKTRSTRRKSPPGSANANWNHRALRRVRDQEQSGFGPTGFARSRSRAFGKNQKRCAAFQNAASGFKGRSVRAAAPNRKRTHLLDAPPDNAFK